MFRHTDSSEQVYFRIKKIQTHQIIVNNAYSVQEYYNPDWISMDQIS